jgi:mRNA interferase MazF
MLPDDLKVTGVVLADQIKSLDWRARQAIFVCEVPRGIVEEVLDKLGVLIFA